MAIHNVAYAISNQWITLIYILILSHTFSKLPHSIVQIFAFERRYLFLMQSSSAISENIGILYIAEK